jgi:hypothetical protein
MPPRVSHEGGDPLGRERGWPRTTDFGGTPRKTQGPTLPSSTEGSIIGRGGIRCQRGARRGPVVQTSQTTGPEIVHR